MSRATAPAPACPIAPPAEEARARAEALDGLLHAQAAELWGGLSPITLALAATDWALHLATQPAQTSRLVSEALGMATHSARAALTQSHLPRDASDRPFR